MENEDKDYQAFEAIVKKIAKEKNALFNSDNEPTSMTMDEMFDVENPETYLLYGYETGGTSGGNCWGDNANGYSVTDCIDTQFESLDELLDIAVPDIKYSQFRQLKPLYKRECYTDYGYYDNQTDYNVVFIRADELYKKLKEMKLELNLELGYKLREGTTENQK